MGGLFGTEAMARMRGQARVPVLHERVDVAVGAGDVDGAVGYGG